MNSSSEDRVSRSRYNRERAARAEAEELLEQKSRALFEANTALNAHSAELQKAVETRTAELQLALQRAEAASIERSRFIATMSHEIRTPLGGLLGMIDLLTMDETDPKKLEMLNYAQSAGAGLGRIVNDVLDFSKMEAGVFIFEEEHVDIRALVKNVSMLYTSHGAGFTRAITVQIDENVPKLFLNDATRIRQIFSNLISNALRYSTQGPITVRANAKAHEKGALLRCEVEDCGVGIPADKLGDLFKDFSQVANPLTVAAQGTGLGLAICKRIIEGLGGQIGVNSTHGSGSTFWFELAVKSVPHSGEQTAENPQVKQAPPSFSLADKRILIAEDNIINQRMLLAYAEKMGLSADLAENGRIAVEKFAPEKYDLILMDIAMPEMDGIEATRRIHANWPAHSIPPIIALTAHVADAIETEAKQVGVFKILSKPIPFADLKTALEGVLNQTHGVKTHLDTEAIEREIYDDDWLDLISADVANNLLEIFSMDELKDLAHKFVTDSRQRIATLLGAEKAGDHHAISQQAHSLKGACFALGFTEMAGWAESMEKDQSERHETILEIAQKFRSQVERIAKAIGD